MNAQVKGWQSGHTEASAVEGKSLQVCFASSRVKMDTILEAVEEKRALNTPE